MTAVQPLKEMDAVIRKNCNGVGCMTCWMRNSNDNEARKKKDMRYRRGTYSEAERKSVERAK